MNAVNFEQRLAHEVGGWPRCPKCKAKPGRFCTDREGKVVPAHSKRLNKMTPYQREIAKCR